MKKNQGFSAIILLVLLGIGLVVALFLVGKQTVFRNRASETGETGPTPTYSACQNNACVVKQGVGINSCQKNSDCAPKLNPINWSTKTVSLKADDFYLKVNGVKYYAKPDPGTSLSIRSYPRSKTYTTLELTWRENKKDMRLYSYYYADKNRWWVNEVRSYNGQTPRGWIYYSVNPTRKYTLGQSLTGTFTVPSAPKSKISGEIYFKNIKFLPFPVK